jgi:precorrin-2 dehydrogenase/sirohydrochlorin ferrochelatase
MIPVTLDPRFLNLAVAGNGALALRRLRALRHAGAAEVLLFADAPDAELAAEAGPFLRRAWPDEAALQTLHMLWIVDAAPTRASDLATLARGLRVLVNVEDVPDYCDFHSVAELRRGDLLLTVSTNGLAPGLAGTIRRTLETSFGPEWGERVSEIATLRQGWHAEGVSMPEAARRIEAIVAERHWLPVAERHRLPVAERCWLPGQKQD